MFAWLWTDPGKMGFNAWTSVQLCPVVSELLTDSPEWVHGCGLTQVKLLCLVMCLLVSTFGSVLSKLLTDSPAERMGECVCTALD